MGSETVTKLERIYPRDLEASPPGAQPDPLAPAVTANPAGVTLTRQRGLGTSRGRSEGPRCRSEGCNDYEY
jgi:hypothetical protein